MAGGGMALVFVSVRDVEALAAHPFLDRGVREHCGAEAFVVSLATAAAVFGAPGADALLATLKRITREELRELRSEMVSMGMQA